jgi:hypothetical protein
VTDCLSLFKVDGEMKWNPRAQRWEGNESVLRDFEKVLSSSSRPALITRFSSGASLSIRKGGIGSIPSGGKAVGAGDKATAALGGARVVGHMYFDPVRMSWFNRHPEGEEELALLEEDDDGSTTAVWAETGRLKTKASFASESATTLTTTDEETAEEADDVEDMHLPSSLGWGAEGAAFWRECQKAKQRHVEEMRGWRRSPQAQRAAEDDRTYLWAIRKVRLSYCHCLFQSLV